MDNCRDFKINKLSKQTYKNFKQTQIEAINYVAKKADINQYRNRLNKTKTSRFGKTYVQQTYF